MAEKGLKTASDPKIVANQMKMADAVGQDYKNKYGDWEKIKTSFAEHPVNSLLDASIVLDAGATAAAKAPMLAGKLSRAAALTNPFKVVGTTLEKAGKISTVPLGYSTGAGELAIQDAAKAGREGGSAQKAFEDNITGKESGTAVVQDAKAAAENLIEARSRSYLENMASTKQATAPVDVAPINKAFVDLKNSLFVEGTNDLTISKPALQKMKEIGQLLTKWQRNPKGNTAIGLDGLKRAIDDLMPAMTEQNANAARVVTVMRNAVKDAIVKQVPEYAKAMSEYETASNDIKEITKSLSLGDKASQDTALRKLQSVLRDNANSNYGTRLESVQKLEAAGAKDIMPKLAGQALRSKFPRGIAKYLTPGGIGLAAASAAGLASNPLLALTAIPGIALTSPRLVGHLANYAGKGARVAAEVPNRLLVKSSQLSDSMQRNRLMAH